MGETFPGNMSAFDQTQLETRPLGAQCFYHGSIGPQLNSQIPVLLCCVFLRKLPPLSGSIGRQLSSKTPESGRCGFQSCSTVFLGKLPHVSRPQFPHVQPVVPLQSGLSSLDDVLLVGSLAESLVTACAPLPWAG